MVGVLRKSTILERSSTIPNGNPVDGTVSTRRVSQERTVFAVLPGRPRRTLEGVHSTTVPHTALKSILASLSVRNLHRVVCRGSRTVDGKTHCLAARPFLQIGRRSLSVARMKPAYIRFVLTPLPISRPSRLRRSRYITISNRSILDSRFLLLFFSLSFRSFFFHPFFTCGEMEVSLSLSLSLLVFSSAVCC